VTVVLDGFAFGHTVSPRGAGHKEKVRISDGNGLDELPDHTTVSLVAAENP